MTTYAPPTDARMEYPGYSMHCRVTDAFSRRWFLRQLEANFRACETAANRLRRPGNRVAYIPPAPTVVPR